MLVQLQPDFNFFSGDNFERGLAW